MHFCFLNCEQMSAQVVNEEKDQIGGYPPIAFSQSQIIQSHINAIDDAKSLYKYYE